MFDKLVDLVVQFIHLFFFVTVTPQYCDGVILRFGKFNRMATPSPNKWRGGLHFILPLRIENVHTVSTIIATKIVGPQSLTTKDGVSVIISTLLTYSIFDAKKYLLDVDSGKELIEDSTYGLVAAHVMTHTWKELMEEDTANELSIVIRRTAKRYGVAVERVQLIDFTRSRSYRLMTQEVLPHTGTP